MATNSATTGSAVSTFVEIARTLRELDPDADIRISDAAMQANFGTPWGERSPGAADGGSARRPKPRLASDEEEEGGLLDQFLDEIAGVKPGDGPSTGWETMTALDVNGDGYDRPGRSGGPGDRDDRGALFRGGAVPGLVRPQAGVAFTAPIGTGRPKLMVLRDLTPPPGSAPPRSAYFAAETGM